MSQIISVSNNPILRKCQIFRTKDERKIPSFMKFFNYGGREFTKRQMHFLKERNVASANALASLLLAASKFCLATSRGCRNLGVNACIIIIAVRLAFSAGQTMHD